MSTTVADLISGLPAGAVSRASATPPVSSVLPVPDALRPVLIGGGLRRGSTVEIGIAGPLAPGRSGGGGSGDGGSGDGGSGECYREAVGPGGCSVLLLLLARVSGAGSWCALVNGPGIGLAAAAEAGVDLDRLALVPEPGRDWVRVVGALLDGFDLVAVRPPTALRPADERWLAARIRRHGTVLVSLGPWVDADVRLRSTAARWEGLGDGFGQLAAQRLSVGVSGRGVVGARSATVEIRPAGSPDPLVVAGPELADAAG
jgi:hypothetical protein